ncbi:MAG: hypothetical protein IKG39_10240, partial [Lachnospiraceae bacterium]|nr:hypothetical protein [Lachnospiraceae bacterium]
QGTRSRVASNPARGWQANKKRTCAPLVVLGLCPKRKNHPLGGWILIVDKNAFRVRFSSMGSLKNAFRVRFCGMGLLKNAFRVRFCGMDLPKNAFQVRFYS